MKSKTVKIMPCLDMQNGRVVKGVKFVDIRDAGDPSNVAVPTARLAPMRLLCWILRPRWKADGLCSTW